MADNDKPRITSMLPAILTGLAALIAALTGVYVNLRGNQPQAPQAIVLPAPAPAPIVEAKPSAPVVQAPQPLRLQVERIAVQHDGTMGTTDWRFAVEADGQPLFVFQADGLDDTGGRNVATPDDVGALLRASAQPHTIVVKGWRSSRIRITPGEPDAVGEGTLGAPGTTTPITVSARKPEGGTFVFYVSAYHAEPPATHGAP